MINPKELRIGNWYILKHGKGWSWVQISESDIVSIFNVTGSFTLNDFEPIIITPEILKICEFIKSGHSWSLNGNFFLKIEEHGSWVNGAPIEPIKYMAYKSGIGAIIEIKFLHRLQNLYFEIFDKELEIKL